MFLNECNLKKHLRNSTFLIFQIKNVNFVNSNTLNTGCIFIFSSLNWALTINIPLTSGINDKVSSVYTVKE